MIHDDSRTWLIICHCYIYIYNTNALVHHEKMDNYKFTTIFRTNSDTSSISPKPRARGCTWTTVGGSSSGPSPENGDWGYPWE